jgi:NitT/TauT family transport system ATP-binding protein
MLVPAAQMPSINPTVAAVGLRDLTRSFKSESGTYTAVKDINFDAKAGSFLSLVGPSGCGKSTILNMIAGLLAPTTGVVEVFGTPLRGLNKRASYMFQQDSLLPWKTVEENIGLGLQFRRKDRREAIELAGAWVRRVGLEGFEKSYPYQLSGGMRKRVSMAQSWIVDPDIILMDEPFGALDVHTRQRMEGEILDLWAGSGKTVLFITHDLEEAIGLSDHVIVLSAGPGSHIVASHNVDLPRPRNLIDIKTDPRFAELYRIIWSDLRHEVLKSYERNHV